MRKYCIILILVILQSVGYCQNIKVYQGPYGNYPHGLGTATYQYYETANSDRILEGGFKYEEHSGDVQVIVNGSYANNKKSGIWKYTRKWDKNTYPAIYTATGKYIDGQMTGLWTAEKCEIHKNGEKEITFQSSINVKNNIITGAFKWLEKDAGNPGNVSIDGSFTDNGLFDGTWTIKTGIYESVRKYKNGFLYWRLDRNVSTGAIIKRFDNTEIMNKYFQSHDSVSNDDDSKVEGTQDSTVQTRTLYSAYPIDVIQSWIDASKNYSDNLYYHLSSFEFEIIPVIPIISYGSTPLTHPRKTVILNHPKLYPVYPLSEGNKKILDAIYNDHERMISNGWTPLSDAMYFSDQGYTGAVPASGAAVIEVGEYYIKAELRQDGKTMAYALKKW